MPRRVEVLPVRDFTGGLNYNADAFQLQDSQVTDCLNVDFDPNGGFRRRDCAQAINLTAIADATPTAVKPKNLWTFTSGDGNYKHICVQAGNDFAYGTGGNFTTVNPDALATTGIMNAAQAHDLLYVQRNAEQVAFKWSGAATTVLADSHGAYNDNFAAPAGGKMPKAKYICHHLNYLFHANINEAGTMQRDRVRFSHPFSDLHASKGAEDYRTNDWFFVGRGDGDEITGMVSFQKELVIFKNNSVWVLRGYDAQSFQLENVSRKVGAVHQRAIAVGDEGVYFFSWPNGLQLYDGSSVRDLWYPLTPITSPNGNGTTIDQLSADPNYVINTTVGYVNQRCWVSLTLGGDTVNKITFVFDPRLGRGGGWTRYNLPLGAYTTLHPPSGDREWFAVSDAATGFVLKLHTLNGGFKDRLSASGGVGVDTGVTSWTFTKWYDLGNAALVKRWKHPIIVCDSASDVTLTADVFRDYDLTAPTRSFNLDIVGPPAPTTWGGSTWGGGTWSTAINAAAQSIERGGLLGRGTAIAMKVSGPATGDIPWSVNAITLKYIPKRIRS